MKTQIDVTTAKTYKTKPAAASRAAALNKQDTGYVWEYRECEDGSWEVATTAFFIARHAAALAAVLETETTVKAPRRNDSWAKRLAKRITSMFGTQHLLVCKEGKRYTLKTDAGVDVWWMVSGLRYNVLVGALCELGVTVSDPNYPTAN